MSEKLDSLVEKYASFNSEKILNQDAPQDAKEEYFAAVKHTLKKQIYEEIEIEVRDKAVATAQKEIERLADQKRIDEYKKLMFEGFLVAFFVGLLVNQSTNIIEYLKELLEFPKIGSTLIIIIVLLVVCGVIYCYRFISELIRMLKSNESN